EIDLKYNLDTVNYKFKNIEDVNNFSNRFKYTYFVEEIDSCFLGNFDFLFIVEPKKNDSISKYGYMTVSLTEKKCKSSAIHNVKSFNRAVNINEKYEADVKLSSEIRNKFMNISKNENDLLIDIIDEENEVYLVYSSYDFPNYYLTISLLFDRKYEKNALRILNGF